MRLHQRAHARSSLKLAQITACLRHKATTTTRATASEPISIHPLIQTRRAYRTSTSQSNNQTSPKTTTSTPHPSATNSTAGPSPNHRSVRAQMATTTTCSIFPHSLAKVILLAYHNRLPASDRTKAHQNQAVSNSAASRIQCNIHTHQDSDNNLCEHLPASRRCPGSHLTVLLRYRSSAPGSAHPLLRPSGWQARCRRGRFRSRLRN